MPAPDWYHPVDFTDVQRLRRCDPVTRWVFVELFCGELGSKTGLVDVRPALVAAENDWTRSQVESAIADLVRLGLVVYCPTTRTAYHVGHLLRHGASNDKHRAGWERTIESMPDSKAKVAALGELRGFPYPTDTLSEGYPDASDTLRAREQEQEQEREGSEDADAPAPVAADATTDAPPRAGGDDEQAPARRQPKLKLKSTKAPPGTSAPDPARGFALVRLWNELLPDNGIASFGPKGRWRTRCNAIFDEYGEHGLRDLLTDASRHHYWSGRKGPVPFAKVVSTEGWDLFVKEIGFWAAREAS